MCLPILNMRVFDLCQKEMTHVFPNSLRINRGRYVLEDLVDISRRNNVTDLIILHEHRGEPGADIYAYSSSHMGAF